MTKHWLTDDTGTILAVFNDDAESRDLAHKQGKALAKAFPDSEIYLHSGTFAVGAKFETGMGSSMRGTLIRFYKDGRIDTVNLFSGNSTSHQRDSSSHAR